MRVVVVSAWVAAVALGVGAEALAWDGPARSGGDLVAGWALLVAGFVAWRRRPESRVGALLGAAGATWFLGTLVEPLALLHRGFLVHALLSYPTGRLERRSPAMVIAVLAYGVSLVPGVASEPWVTALLVLAVGGAALGRYLRATGQTRRARLAPLLATLVLGASLVLAAGAYASDDRSRTGVVLAYDAAIVAVALILALDLVRADWAGAAVTSLVVDLGESAGSTGVAGGLSRALGDPSLEIGFRDGDSYVDEAGRRLDPPAGGTGQITYIEDNGERVAMVVHDSASLNDRALLEPVGSVIHVALANARLQAAVRSRVDEVEQSRLRIVEAEAETRRRLGEELRAGPEARLVAFERLVAESAPALGTSVRAALGSLDELGRGLYPVALSAAGLRPALAALTAGSAIPVSLDVADERFPEPVETAAYFVCAEAVANALKHSGASRIEVTARRDRDDLAITIDDDGNGRVDLGGFGIRGLRDRVEALGGHFEVTSRASGGTRVSARLPG